MIPQAYRLKLKPHHAFLGKKHRYSWGLVVTAASPSPQWAVSVSKKAAAAATDRNRIRRQITQFFYISRSRLDPHLSFYILITRPQPDSQEIIRQLCLLLFTAP